MTAAYWWNARQSEKDIGRRLSNFGDTALPLLFFHFSGISVRWSSPAEASLVGIGSVLDVLPRTGWAGVVAGSGQLKETTSTVLDQAIVLGVRGLLTRERVTLKGRHQSVVYGDPMLLASELVATERETVELGVVPHWSDTTLFDRFAYLHPVLIDPCQDPSVVIRQIGACKKIVTSSLHGAVVADSFGIPRRVEIAPGMTKNPNEGGAFKFHDYASVLGEPIHFGERHAAPRTRIDIVKAELFDMFKEVPEALKRVA
jgi:hypothetical protein